MRAAADFNDADGMFYCPRSQVQPPPELAKRIFPWADEQLENVKAAILERAHSIGGNFLGSAKSRVVDGFNGGLESVSDGRKFNTDSKR